jgi:hypothetical protein
MRAETASALATQIQADFALLSGEPTFAAWQKSHADGKVDLAHYETEKDTYEVGFARLDRWCAASVSRLPSQAVRAALFYVPSIKQGGLPPLLATKNAATVSACRMQAIWYETAADTSISAFVNGLASFWGSPDGQTTTPDIGGAGLWKDVVAWHRNGVSMWAAYDPKGKLGGSARPRLIVYVRRDMPCDPANIKFGLLPDSIRYQVVEAAAHIAAHDDLLTSPVLERSRCLDQIPARESESLIVNHLARWLEASAKLSATRRAAALVLADAYMRCAPLAPEHFTRLGANSTVYCPQDGATYDGNFLQQAQELDPKGPAGELANLAALGMPCWLNGDRPWPDLAITNGEKLLVEFSPDRWTPWIHFAIARAHAAKLSFASPGGNPEGETTPLTPAAMNEERRAAIRHFEEFIRAIPQAPEAISGWEEAWRLTAGFHPAKFTSAAVANRHA